MITHFRREEKEQVAPAGRQVGKTKLAKPRVPVRRFALFLQ
jgi:hypothetical protein